LRAACLASLLLAGLAWLSGEIVRLLFAVDNLVALALLAWALTALFACATFGTQQGENDENRSFRLPPAGAVIADARHFRRPP
jgi:hypothetical protein